MLKNYFKRSAMLLGAVAVIATASAQGAYVDVTHKYLKDPTYVPGWQGVFGELGDGVAATWNGAFRIYQVLPDMPAGEYTLTCNAFYRCGNNGYSKEHMKGATATPELYRAFIFINNDKVAVKGAFDDNKDLPAKIADDKWEDFNSLKHVPNNLYEANLAFIDKQYINTMKATHKGGDMIIGIVNEGCYNDEWCAFDNFTLVGPNGNVEIPNGDFSTGIDSKRSWDDTPSGKTPDIQKDGSGGGDYRKCGGSPYNFGQQVDLPAGKYRFGMLCFHRYGSEVDAEGNYYNHKWPCDKVDGGKGYGDAGRTPKDWYDANDYEDNKTYAHAYVYMSMADTKPTSLKWTTERGGKLNPETDKRTRVRDCWEIWEGDLDKMPHNNPVRVAGNTGEEWLDVIPYETRNKVIYRNDSGCEREAAAAFVHEPEKYYHYVEFELTEPAKVWVGMGKDAQTGDGYWHAWADQKLEMFDANAGVDNVIADEAINENAPVEYYNLQGVRVAEPANGLYIVKQGNKVSKQIIR